MKKDFLGMGWKYPVYVDFNEKIAMSEHESDIKESIWIILGTAKGERVMQPEFGCGIHEMVFSSLNTTTITLMENSVKEALTLWEPRIQLHNVEANDEQVENGKIIINIEYIVRQTNNRFNLVYPFYLKEGS